MRRRHPVAQLLSAAAQGGLPSQPELDELRLSPGDRRKVEEAAKVAAAHKAEGSNKAARDAARESATRIVAELPGEQQSPDYLRPPDNQPDDPEALAARVRRW